MIKSKLCNMIDNQKWSDTGPLWLEGQCRDDRKVKRQMSHQKPPAKIHQRILSIKLYWNINALTRLSIFYHSPSRWLRQEKIAGDLNHSVVHLCFAMHSSYQRGWNRAGNRTFFCNRRFEPVTNRFPNRIQSELYIRLWTGSNNQFPNQMKSAILVTCLDDGSQKTKEGEKIELFSHFFMKKVVKRGWKSDPRSLSWKSA